MRIMKFGGSSLATVALLSTVADQVVKASREGRVVVVTSAVAGITDLLDTLTQAPRDQGEQLVEDFILRHRALWTELGLRSDDFDGAFRELEGELNTLRREAEETTGWGTPSKDQALGAGERASTILLAETLRSRGLAAWPLDSRKVILTDSSFGAAQVDLSATLPLARRTLERIPTHVVPVVPGFTGGDTQGRWTTLGRGASDLSATVVGTALSAELVEIWTDVDGVFDRDPALHPSARLIPRLGYAGARALAKKGAKVLHPKSLDPIEPLGIPLRIRNTSRPNAPGTLVMESVEGCPRVQGDSGGLRRISLVIAGATGGVGKALLNQLDALTPKLKEENVELRVVGAFSRRSQYWNPLGVEATGIPAALYQGSPDWDEITRILTHRPPENPVFVDCTASPEVSNQYLSLLRAGIPVVTPNKLACSGSLEAYRSLQRVAAEGSLPYRYETTVGAALPILKTVRDLRRAGDRFKTITAVLSGTLSFVFGMLAEGASFSEAVRAAREAGLTEPDPRADLTGADVARKLLILLREAGYDLEPDAIPVESLVPESLAHTTDPEAFLLGLKKFDAFWSTRRPEGASHQLAYVAWFEGESAGVGVLSLSPDHPLFGLKPTENRVVFTTDRYPSVPLTIAGPGAGREVTASGVIADLLGAIRDRYGQRRVA